MKTLSLDLETYSSVDLGKSSVYRYVESPDFAILLLAYSIDGAAVQVVDLAQGESIPSEVIQALSDEHVQKWAFNASFERVCLSEWLRRNGHPLHNEFYSVPEDTCMSYLDPTGWHCTMVWSAYLGLPLSLKDAGAALGLDKQKLSEGKELIKYFCVPGRDGKRHMPADAPERWEAFKAYNLRDVETEMSIQERLRSFPVPDEVWEQYRLDQQINDRGIAVDMTLVKSAIAIDEHSREELTAKLQELTMLDNPNSVQQMKSWLAENGMETDTLGKKQVTELLKTAPEPLKSVLVLRQQLAKSSVKKYQAMENSVCADGRVHGCFQFYGARTGRWAGRNIQLQNLPQNKMPDLEQARSLVRSGDYEGVRMLYDSTPDVLSQLIRTAFVPKKGSTFFVADFSAIEARVIAWLAGEQWRLELFQQGGDIYCQSASQMFGVPVEKHGVNAHLRQKGKIAELACIAEGQMVLTDKGEVPIQNVTTDMKVWDGERWVAHDGLVYRGEREVITYEGLTATPDHLVWIEGKPEPVSLEEAMLCHTRLIQVATTSTPSTMLNPTPALMRTYDLKNAGPNHRFTVSGHLVHNCGYGGSVGALKAMGALEMGLQEDELKPLVDAWRTANPKIVKLWWEVDDAVMTAIRQKTVTRTHGILFCCKSGMLFITLPSGRQLAYVKPRIGENQFGGSAATYMGTNTAKQWARLESYGPKFVENIVQAISRDILCFAMQTLRTCSIVAHVHDELIIEATPGMSLEKVCEQMGRTPSWAQGLQLRADGYATDFYKKD